VNRASSLSAELSLHIAGVESPTIAAYFNNLNNGEFAATAALFADNGCLNPPFERPIARDEIATYLEREARGMIFYPESGAMLMKDDDLAQYHIQGQVKTNYFTINVSWLMQLTSDNRILLVEVKLLATLAELLKVSR
jgi:hypothetical protein